MSLRLYDNRDSTNGLKLRFLLAELGEAVERVEVPIGAAPDDYRRIHPFGLVPALVDGELAVTESNTALRYLAERAGRHDLRGADPVARARVDTVLDSLSLELRPVLWGVEAIVVYGQSPADEAARRAALAAALDAFDALLDPAGPHALGATFTIADCALAGRCLHLERLGVPTSVAPRLRRALAAATARPAWSRAR